MNEYLSMLLNWAEEQSLLTGALILGAGLLNAFLGFRMVRFLLVLSTGALAALLAAYLAVRFEFSTTIAAGVGALAGGTLALFAYRTALFLNVGFTFALLTAYVSAQFGAPHVAMYVATALVATSASVLTLLAPRTMPLIVTAMHGAILMIVGFVGVADTFVPTLGATLRHWAGGRSVMIPALLTMLTAMGFSIQEMKRQGDICTGK